MSADSKPPTKYGVVLYPGFQSLDVFGPCDLLATHSRFNTVSVAMLSSTLEPVPSNLLPTGGCGQLVVPTHTFDNAPDDIEVLLVPGGPGTRDDDSIAPAMAYVKKVYPKLRYLLAVCTGSALVAKTGLLDGKRATTNKKAFKWVSSLLFTPFFVASHFNIPFKTTWPRLTQFSIFRQPVRDWK